MSASLSFQVQSWTTDSRALLRATWPRWLMLLQDAIDLPLLHDAVSHGLQNVVYRRVFAETSNLAEMDHRLAETLEHAERLRPLMARGIRVVVLVPYNEELITTAEQLGRLSTATIPAVERITAAGFDAGIGSIAEGNPAMEGDVAAFAPAMRHGRAIWLAGQRRVYLCLHGYSTPTLGSHDPDHLLRYRRLRRYVPADARLPFLMTEGPSFDGNIEHLGAHGWRAYNWDAERYARDFVRPAHAELLRDDDVHAAFQFVAGALSPWESYEVAGVPALAVVVRDQPPGAPAWEPTEERMQVYGVDVSNNQGAIDWAALRASNKVFACMKASGDEGAGNVFLDPYFPEFWHQSNANEVARVAYHYARPSAVSPAASVTTLQRAIQAVGGLRAGDNLALDIEDPAVPDGVSLHVWVAEWLALTEQVFGATPGKYSARYYTSTHDLEHADLERFWTWWAAWQNAQPAGVPGWTPIKMWQYSATGAAPGVAGPCDLDVFNGSVDELRALGLAAPAAVDWEIPVLGPIYRGAAAVPGMPDRTPDDEADAREIIRVMDKLKARHPPH